MYPLEMPTPLRIRRDVDPASNAVLITPLRTSKGPDWVARLTPRASAGYSVVSTIRGPAAEMKKTPLGFRKKLPEPLPRLSGEISRPSSTNKPTGDKSVL